MNETDYIYKVMIHEDKKDVFVYLYTSIDAISCSSDNYYKDVSDAIEDWDCEIDEHGWIQMDDPLPYCQYDCFLPMRVKGRNSGDPQWGKFEILVENEWIDWNDKNKF